MISKQNVKATLTFIMGGVSAKSNKPYLKVSNGRSEFFVIIPKGVEIVENTFSGYNENDEITLVVSILVGTDSVTLVSVEKSK
jgi:hypothetical protein